jgi:hypothetical protein
VNIILVVFDSLRKDCLGAYGSPPWGKVHTPPFLEQAIAGRPGGRDHVTVGWGSYPTVITDRWWLNCKVDGTGVILHDLKRAGPFVRNVAGSHPAVVNDLFALAVQDARGGFPGWLMELARQQADAPGCSDLAARP